MTERSSRLALAHASDSVLLCNLRHYADEPPLYRDQNEGLPYSHSSYSNGYSEGRRTTRRRLLPATPTGRSSFLSGSYRVVDVIDGDVSPSPVRSEAIF